MQSAHEHDFDTQLANVPHYRSRLCEIYGVMFLPFGVRWPYRMCRHNYIETQLSRQNEFVTARKYQQPQGRRSSSIHSHLYPSKAIPVAILSAILDCYRGKRVLSAVRIKENKYCPLGEWSLSYIQSARTLLLVTIIHLQFVPQYAIVKIEEARTEIITSASITVWKEGPTPGSGRSCQIRCIASPVQAYSHSSSVVQGFSVCYDSARNKCVCNSDPSSCSVFGGWTWRVAPANLDAATIAPRRGRDAGRSCAVCCLSLQS